MTTKNNIHEINLPTLNALKDIGSEKYNEYKEKFLIAEAKRRYGDDWGNAEIKCLWHKKAVTHTSQFYDFKADKLWGKKGCIYYRGKWAEIIDYKSDLKNEIKELEERLKDLRSKL